MFKKLISERVKNLQLFEHGTPYHTHRIVELAIGMMMEDEDIIFVQSNALPFDTPTHIKDAAKRALDEGFTRMAPVLGIPELREAIAEKLERVDSVKVDKYSEIIVTHGAEEAIFLAISSLINPGDEVLECSPDYPFYLHVQYMGGTPRYVPLKKEENWRLEQKDLERRVTSKTKMIVLDSPHNPTGRVFTRDELEGIAEVAERHDLIVLSDVANETLVWDGRKNINIASLPGMQARTITTGSVTKCYGMSGWRVGYASADKDLIFQMSKLHMVSCNSGPATFAQKGVVALYEGPQKPLKDLLEPCARRRDLAVKRFNEMPGISCHKPEGGAILIPDISTYGMSSVQFAEWLLKEAKVATAPGSGYLAEGRIRVLFPEPRIEEALDRIESALEKLK